MNKNIFILITVILISIEGCIAPSYQTTEAITPSGQEPVTTAPVITAPIPIPGAPTSAQGKTEKSDLLIDRISENLTSFYDLKWNTLYQADELDCSRMSTYFWDYIRRNFHVALPKVVAEDKQRFLINDREYSSTEFYSAAIYLLDTPQDANDFHAQNSALGSWNQEFRLKKNDLDKISWLLVS